MRFTKMNGLGNDFIVIHDDHALDRMNEMAVAMCDRHFGIGADGLVFILPSKNADFRMRIINPDGSEPEQCGNAIRCVAKYVYDHQLTDKTEISIETLAGIQNLQLFIDQEKVMSVQVNMGPPILHGESIPTIFNKEKVLNQEIEVSGEQYLFTAISMGNPHAIINVENAESFPVDEIGPIIEKHNYFPNKTNVEFITIHSPEEMTMRVWERGAGQTYACGTGACASVVSSVLNNQTNKKVLVHLKGGDLLIEWNQEDGNVYMTGPAEEVFVGEWVKSF